MMLKEVRCESVSVYACPRRDSASEAQQIK